MRNTNQFDARTMLTNGSGQTAAEAARGRGGARRWIAAAGLAVALAAAGAGVAYASGAFDSVIGSFDGTNAPTFSTDGGQTWSAEAPEGVTVSQAADGSWTVATGDAGALGEVVEVAVPDDAKPGDEVTSAIG